MTEIQQMTQCDGPSMPTAGVLAELLHTIPSHVDVRAISIRGQGGSVVIEYTHEGLDRVVCFTACGHDPKTNVLKFKETTPHR